MARQGTRDELTVAGKNMLKAMYKLKERPYVKVGFPTKAFEKLRKKEKSANETKASLTAKAPQAEGDEPYTVGEVAVANEFGTDHIPERSFIRSTHDKNQKEWWEATKKLKLKVLLLAVSCKDALGYLGEIIKRDIQATIRKGGDPLVPNAPSTIAKKGSDHPLVDKAQMLNAVTYERVNAD